jgi:hypothetical protein
MRLHSTRPSFATVDSYICTFCELQGLRLESFGEEVQILSDRRRQVRKRAGPPSTTAISPGAEDEKQEQWYLLDSRLPYLLDYARQVVEHVYRHLARTDPVYLQEMERRSMAATLLWAPPMDPHYKSAELERYVTATSERLRKHCRDAGFDPPAVRDLAPMRDTGAYPGESMLRVRARGARYSASAWPHRVLRLLKRVRPVGNVSSAKKS